MHISLTFSAFFHVGSLYITKKCSLAFDILHNSAPIRSSTSLLWAENSSILQSSWGAQTTTGEAVPGLYKTGLKTKFDLRIYILKYFQRFIQPPLPPTRSLKRETTHQARRKYPPNQPQKFWYVPRQVYKMTKVLEDGRGYG